MQSRRSNVASPEQTPQDTPINTKLRNTRRGIPNRALMSVSDTHFAELVHRAISDLLIDMSGHRPRPQSLRFASLRFASLRFASLRFASLRFGLVWC